MAFNTEELGIIKFGKEQGKSRQEVEDALFNYRSNRVITKEPEAMTFGQDFRQDISQVGTDLKGTLDRTVERVGEVSDLERAGEQNKITGFAKKFGLTLGGLSQGFGDVIKGGVKAILPQKQEEQVKQGLATGIEKALPVLNTLDEMVGSPVGTRIEAYKNLDEKDKATIDAFLGTAMFAADVAGVGLGKKAIAQTGKLTKKVASEVAEQTFKKVDDIVEFIARKSPDLKIKASKILATEPADKVKTILKETPVSKLDEFVDIAKAHSVDQRTISGFEKVGERISEATKQLQSQLSAIGESKSSILQKAKVGLVEFKDAPRRAIIEVMKLEDTPIRNQIINRLKSIKTKLDADRVIDEIQDIIYTGGRDLTLPTGSRLNKQLRGIIGKLNTELKDSLPDVYKNLNAQYSNKIKAVDVLNRSLSEVVEGVPTRGASLVKQFFSPTGTKTKQLFEYIKKTTGIDLAQDATLAKFAEELFDNPEVRSLLTGIPKTKGGVIDKLVDFTVEKTGVGKKLQEKVRESTIKKAKEFTK